MKLGKRIATAIKMAGTTTPAIARAAGVPSSTLNALMRRDSGMTSYTEAILAVLPKDRVNIDWVRTGQGDPAPADGEINKPIKPISTSPAHCSKETDLIVMFRKLDGFRQASLLALVRSCVELTQER